MIVIVTAVVPVVMGIAAPDTTRVTTCPAMLGVTNAVPMLKTSMPDGDVTPKLGPKVTVREDPDAIAVFIKNESTTLLQGPVLQEVTAAEVTIKPDRGPVGDPALALSIVVETVTVSKPPVAAPVVSPVTVTVCAPAASGPVPASVMTPELKLKKV